MLLEEQCAEQEEQDGESELHVDREHAHPDRGISGIGEGSDPGQCICE